MPFKGVFKVTEYYVKECKKNEKKRSVFTFRTAQFVPYF